MEKKPKPEQCVKGVCLAIENYCKNIDCSSKKDLSDVEAVYMVFIRKSGKARLHLIGPMSAAQLMETTEASLHEMVLSEHKEGNPLAG